MEGLHLILVVWFPGLNTGSTQDPGIDPPPLNLKELAGQIFDLFHRYSMCHCKMFLSDPSVWWPSLNDVDGRVREGYIYICIYML